MQPAFIVKVLVFPLFMFNRNDISHPFLPSVSKNTPMSQVTDPPFSGNKRTNNYSRKHKRGSSCYSYSWLLHTSATEKVSNTLLQSAEFFHWMSATVTETESERKWAWCLSLDTGCDGACELKYQPLLLYTVKEWQPHDCLCTSHAYTQWMHVYR